MKTPKLEYDYAQDDALELCPEEELERLRRWVEEEKQHRSKLTQENEERLKQYAENPIALLLREYENSDCPFDAAWDVNSERRFYSAVDLEAIKEDYIDLDTEKKNGADNGAVEKLRIICGSDQELLSEECGKLGPIYSQGKPLRKTTGSEFPKQVKENGFLKK